MISTIERHMINLYSIFKEKYKCLVAQEKQLTTCLGFLNIIWNNPKSPADYGRFKFTDIIEMDQAYIMVMPRDLLIVLKPQRLDSGYKKSFDRVQELLEYYQTKDLKTLDISIKCYYFPTEETFIIEGKEKKINLFVSMC